MTNQDRLQHMSREELAIFLSCVDMCKLICDRDGGVACDKDCPKELDRWLGRENDIPTVGKQVTADYIATAALRMALNSGLITKQEYSVMCGQSLESHDPEGAIIGLGKLLRRKKNNGCGWTD